MRRDILSGFDALTSGDVVGDGLHIPFNRPTLCGMELVYITRAVESMHLSGDGEFTAKC